MLYLPATEFLVTVCKQPRTPVLQAESDYLQAIFPLLRCQNKLYEETLKRFGSAEKNAAKLEGLQVKGQMHVFVTKLVVKTHLRR